VVGLVVESLAMRWFFVRLILPSIPIFLKKIPLFLYKFYFDAKMHKEISMQKWMCRAGGEKVLAGSSLAFVVTHFQFKNP